ncbi:MAG: VOC family protein [Xenococcaceae cyanobacterium]
MTAKFKHIMLMVKDIPSAVKFYSEGLGLEVKMSSPGWAELDADGTILAFHSAPEDGQSGGSPILSFHVEDVHEAVNRLEQMGAELQGRIREPSFGKVAAVRSPDGTILSLLEPAAVESPEH